ncbi:MAG: AAA family ATPase, partial [Pontixanthobacter sp.]
AQSFGLEVEGHDKARALGAIEHFLHEEARAGRRSLLIVDESQNLSVEALEELRMLSNFQLGSHPLLQLLLLGQPEFKKVLAEHAALEQLRQRVIAAHHLEEMKPSEIEPYIHHRLECVGWDGNPAIDRDVFTELFEATGGIPRRVNQVATRLLLLGAVEQRTRIDNAMLRSVLKEMEGDNAFREAAPNPTDLARPAPGSGPVKHIAAETVPAVDEPAADIAILLEERDFQIRELQQAVVELSRKINADRSIEDEGIARRTAERISELEAKMDDQDAAVRHVLTMLIEWIETGESPRAAA